jgi:hypothetical protein
MDETEFDNDVTAEDVIQKLGLEKTKNSWHNYVPHILCIIMFFLLLYTCSREEKGNTQLAQLNTELIQLKKDYKVKEDYILSQNDSLKQDNSLKEAQNDSLQLQHQQDLIALEKSKQKRDVKRAKIEKFSNNEYATWFGERYNEVENVTSTPDGIELKNDIPKMVAMELNDYDFAREELQIKDKTISDYKVEVENKNGIIRNKDTEILNGSILLDDQKAISKKAEEALNESKSDLQKEKNRSTLYKIGVPAAAVLGFIGGVYIAK